MQYDQIPLQPSQSTPTEPTNHPRSPLLDASFAAVPASSFVYPATPTSSALSLRETKERGKWGTSKGKTETDDERSARLEAQRLKVEETHQKVESGLADLAASLAAGKSDQLLALLTTMGRFHRYSWGNTILIAFQNPTATVVAGFTTWKGLGRSVKTGEKGIAVLAPITSKRTRTAGSATETAQAAEETQHEVRALEGEEGSVSSASPRVRGFKVVYVFDVAQTDGKALPEFAAIKGDPTDHLPRLHAQIKAAGIGLDYRDDIGGAFGASYGGRIELKSGMPPAQEFATLIHEFAHELLHPRTERREIPQTVKETEAEAVSFVVSRAVGLEPGTASSDYIQLYRGDTATLAASLDRIQKTANHILTGFEEAANRCAA